MTEYEILRAAHALLSRGWCQERYCTSTKDSFCLEGALAEASFGAPCWPSAFWEGPAFEVERLLLQLLGDEASSSSVKPALATWNDAVDRTRQEVLDLLETAMAITAGLTGPAVPIIVEPVEKPTIAPEPVPAAPPEREPEKVPAGA